MSEYDATIQKAVREHLPGCDWRLYKAQLYEESRLYPLAVSYVGAKGIAQFMPATWAEWAPRAGWVGYPPEHAEASIFTGACYMAYLIAEWSWPRPEIDRHCLAVASYNAGLANLLEAQALAGGAVLYADIARCLPRVTGALAVQTTRYVRLTLAQHARYVTGD